MAPRLELTSTMSEAAMRQAIFDTGHDPEGFVYEHAEDGTLLVYPKGEEKHG